MLKVAEVKEIYELKGEGHGIREIARELDISRNTVSSTWAVAEALPIRQCQGGYPGA